MSQEIFVVVKTGVYIQAIVGTCSTLNLAKDLVARAKKQKKITTIVLMFIRQH